jgi:hypothetical protein
MIVQLRPEVEQALREEAARRGQSAESLIIALVEELLRQVAAAADPEPGQRAAEVIAAWRDRLEAIDSAPAAGPHEPAQKAARRRQRRRP